jgi:hypothetical protein
MKDEQILEYYGWEIICEAPREITTKDGSYATGEAVAYVISGLRQQYIGEQYDKMKRRIKRLRIMEELLDKMEDDE